MFLLLQSSISRQIYSPTLSNYFLSLNISYILLNFLILIFFLELHFFFQPTFPCRFSLILGHTAFLFLTEFRFLEFLTPLPLLVYPFLPLLTSVTFQNNLFLSFHFAFFFSINIFQFLSLLIPFCSFRDVIL